jgi:hypothetical protein
VAHRTLGTSDICRPLYPRATRLAFRAFPDCSFQSRTREATPLVFSCNPSKLAFSKGFGNSYLFEAGGGEATSPSALFSLCLRSNDDVPLQVMSTRCNNFILISKVNHSFREHAGGDTGQKYCRCSYQLLSLALRSISQSPLLVLSPAPAQTLALRHRLLFGRRIRKGKHSPKNYLVRDECPRRAWPHLLPECELSPSK